MNIITILYQLKIDEQFVDYNDDDESEIEIESEEEEEEEAIRQLQSSMVFVSQQLVLI